MVPQAKLALITGGSRGIGRGIALALARAGFGVVVNYVAHREAAEECLRLCEAARPRGSDAPCLLYQADISRAEERERLLSFVMREGGWLDLLVNNAGVAPAARMDLLQATEESFDRLMAINLKAPFFLTQATANLWLARLGELPPERARPKVINISSISAETASSDRGDYCVSKAGLSMVTRLFAARLAEFGIYVYELRPGIIKTEMTAPVQDKYERLIAQGLTPIRRWGTPEDVGRAVVCIAQDTFSFSTGEVMNVDGGFHLRRL